MNPYLGHPSQMHGVEQHRLIGGKGDGLRLLEVRNGLGLELTLCVDRCLDIPRLTFRGNNFGYFSACGYVGPAYFERDGMGFLKAFTGGFMTTCGLRSFGPPCEDEGESLGLHGTATYLPADQVGWREEDGMIYINAIMREATQFAAHLELHREYAISLTENRFTLTDTIINVGPRPTPAMALYHCNLGYPLLSEKALVLLPSKTVTPRDENAKKGLARCRMVEPPQKDCAEQCFHHTFGELGVAGIFNPEIGYGITIEFDPKELPYFTQWKMMGEYEYAMGMEPSTAPLKDRAEMRRDGDLNILAPGESKTQTLQFQIVNNKL
ncbi:MAG: DUF4432 family protein [Ruminococcaceae bacterium]|nr:DUF4432 family protein [Oscillospiraceae bacterium]